jgi:hypothetical protein
MDSTTIQTIAAIQAFASIVFCGSVIFEACMRKRLRERQRRDQLLNFITNLWTPDGGRTIEEQFGIPSQRQIDFFNAKLREGGETWTYPLKRI